MTEHPVPLLDPVQSITKPHDKTPLVVRSRCSRRSPHIPHCSRLPGKTDLTDPEVINRIKPDDRTGITNMTPPKWHRPLPHPDHIDRPRQSNTTCQPPAAGLSHDRTGTSGRLAVSSAPAPSSTAQCNGHISHCTHHTDPTPQTHPVI